MAQINRGRYGPTSMARFHLNYLFYPQVRNGRFSMSLTRQCLLFALLLIAALLSWLVPERERAEPQGNKVN